MEFSRLFLDWWLRIALAGGGILLLGCLLTRLCRQPAKRLAAGFWTLIIALALLPSTLLPGWFALPWQSPFAVGQAFQPAISPARSETDGIGESQWQAEKAGKPAPQNALQVAKEVRPELANRNRIITADLESIPFNEMNSWKAAGVDPATAIATAAPSTTAADPKAAEPELQPSRWEGAARILLAGYVTVVICLLVRLLLAQIGLSRLWRSGHELTGDAGRLFAAMTRHLPCPPRVRTSERIAGPICFGVFRRRIMLPARMAQESDETALSWIFAHELSHLQRNDPLTGWFIGIAQAFYFFCPWFWWLRRSIRLSQEFLADAAAVDVRQVDNPRSSPADYADFLVRLASCRVLPVGASGVRGTSSDLFRRIKMLVQKKQKVEGRCSPRWSLVMGLGLCAFGVALAGFYLPAGSLTAAQSPDTKKAEEKPAPAPDDEAVRRAIEELKKGPAPRDREKDEPKEAPRAIPVPPPARPRIDDPIAELQREQMEQMKRMMDMLQRQGVGQMQDDEVMRMIDQMMRQVPAPLFQMPPMGRMGGGRGVRPGARVNGMNGFNGMNPFNGMNGLNGANTDGGRLGIRIERPSAVLVEQLDLPKEKGMVVSDVRLDSAADKAGIKINDILMEINGKDVPSEPQDLIRMISEIKAETPVDVIVMRKGRKETLKGVKFPEVAQRRQADAALSPRFQGAFGGFVVPDLPGAGEAVKSMMVSRNNDEFSVSFRSNDLKGKIVGIVVDGKPIISDIDMDDNGKAVKAKSLDKLEAKYQKMVREMIHGIQ